MFCFAGFHVTHGVSGVRTQRSKIKISLNTAMSLQSHKRHGGGDIAAKGGKTYLSFEAAQAMRKDISTAQIPLITRREKEILSLIAEGYTNPEIADKLFISPSTVDSHRKNLLAKMNMKNTASLIKFAVENKLIQ